MGKTAVQQFLYEDTQKDKCVQMFHEGSVEKMILYNREHLGIYGEEYARKVMELLGITAEELAAAANPQNTP